MNMIKVEGSDFRVLGIGTARWSGNIANLVKSQYN